MLASQQAWDWVLPIKTEICLLSYLLQSGSIKIHKYCTKKKKKN